MPVPGRTSPKNFPRGAKPTSPEKKAKARKFQVMGMGPDQFAVIPQHLQMWGNDTYGDCVSAEEAFAKAAYSLQAGVSELTATDGEVVQWANSHGFLNGAELGEVLDAMHSQGMSIGSVTYKDGEKQLVDYGNPAALKLAIATGPVKIAIDADALPQGAGNESGWFSTDTQRRTNYDHCVGLCGYGSAEYLFGVLGKPLPSELMPNIGGYLLFTWSTIGFVTLGWINACCCEAWVRKPTTEGYSPTPPPGPNPPPTPGPFNWLDLICKYGPLIISEPWATYLRFICGIIDREKISALSREMGGCCHGEEAKEKAEARS